MTTGRQRVGIKDVALAAGVSVGTVSHVLNRPERVSEQRRTAVLTAIEDLGYVPNHAARQLKVGVSPLVGYLHPNPLNPYYSSLAQGIQQEAEHRGLYVLSATSEGVLDRRRRYLSIFEQQRAHGVIVAPRTNDLTAELATSLRGTPVVLASAREPMGRLCSVAADDVASGRLAVEHLITTGRHRIAAIVTAGSAAGEDRWRGAQLVAERCGGVELLRMPVAEAAFEEGLLVAQTILALPDAVRPDALFCTSDLLALGVLQALVMDGRLRVPRDLAVVGCDDLAFSRSVIIPLTSIQQHEVQMGQIAVGLLEDELTQPGHVHTQVLLDPVLVVRESSRG